MSGSKRQERHKQGINDASKRPVLHGHQSSAPLHPLAESVPQHEQEHLAATQVSNREHPALKEGGTQRIEALSDGVFAIALTLLVLDIHVPTSPIPGGEGTLWVLQELEKQWPSYLSFFLSFLIVGVVWGNHHTMFSYIRRSNHVLIILNLLLLLSIVVIAFTASLLGHYIGTAGQQAAVLVYSGILVIGGIFYNLLWWYASSKARLIDKTLPSELVQRITRRYIMGPVLYTLAFGLSFFWNGTLGLILCLLLALTYLLPTVAEYIRPGSQQ